MTTNRAERDLLLWLSEEEQNVLAAALLFYASRGPTNPKIQELSERVNSAVRTCYVLYNHDSDELLTTHVYPDYQSAVDDIDPRLNGVIAIEIALVCTGRDEEIDEDAGE